MAFEPRKRKPIDLNAYNVLIADLQDAGHGVNRGAATYRPTVLALDSHTPTRFSLALRPTHSHKVLSQSARSIYSLRPQGSPSFPLFPPTSTPRSTLPNPELLSSSRIRAAIRTQTGSMNHIVKPNNQDSAFALEHQGWYLLGVCDGHGLNGHFVSSSVKNSFPKHLFEAISCQNGDDLPTLALKFAYNRSVRILKESKIDCSNSGTTCVTALIHNNTVICGNVGDSRAILGRKVGGIWSAIPLSTDHKPDLPSERARIVQNGGEVSVSKVVRAGPARVYLKGAMFPGLAMSRSIGDEFAKGLGVTAEPELTVTHLEKDDYILILASDGVWEFMSNLEVIQAISAYVDEKDAEKAATALIREAWRRWSSANIGMIDDITAVIAFLR